MIYLKEIGTTLWLLYKSQRVVGRAEILDGDFSSLLSD
jgi:hypothetical protein